MLAGLEQVTYGVNERGLYSSVTLFAFLFELGSQALTTNFSGGPAHATTGDLRIGNIQIGFVAHRTPFIGCFEMVDSLVSQVFKSVIQAAFMGGKGQG